MGLDSELNLSIEAALRQVDSLEAAISKATSDVTLAVQVDGAGVASEIEAAVAAANTDVAVTTDTSEITPAIDEAVAATDAVVPVTADGSEIPAEIEAAVASADVPPIVVEADTASADANIGELGKSANIASEEIDTLGSSTKLFGAAAGVTAGEASGLGEAVSDLGGGAKAAVGIVASLTASTVELFHAGLDAEAAQFRVNQQLGDMASQIETINVGDLNIGLTELSVKLGSSDEAIQNTIANLVQLGVASGVTKQQAIDVSEQFVALAARAVALNPGLGSVGDVAQSLSTALARGGRFAQNFGISLTSAQIQAEALRETGKATATELTNYEKAAAGAKLATDQFGGSLDEVIAAASGNPVLQLRALKTRFEEFLETVGKPLVAPVLQFLGELEPVAEQVAGAVADLLKQLIPLAGPIVQALGPLLVGVVQAAQPLIPILTAVAAVVDAIPAPVLQLIGTLVTLTAVLNALQPVIALTGASATALNPILAALAVGYAIYTTVVNSSAEADAKHAQSVAAVTSALDDNTKSVKENITAAEESLNKTGDLTARIVKAGLSYEDLAVAAIKGKDATEAYIGAVLKQADADNASNDTKFDLIVKLRDQAKALDDAAKAKLTNAIETKALTQADVDAAEASTKNADGTLNYVGALNVLQPKLAATEAAAKAKADADAESARKSEEAQAAAEKYAAALAVLDKGNPSLIDSIASVNGVVGNQASALGDLAFKIRDANLSQDDMAAVADALGVSVDSLTSFVQAATQAVDQFATSAENTVDAPAAIVDAVQNAADTALRNAQTTAQAVESAQKQADSAATSAEDAHRRADQAAEKARTANADQTASFQSAQEAAVNAATAATEADQRVLDAQQHVAEAAQGVQADLVAAFDPTALADQLQASTDAIVNFQNNLEFLVNSQFPRLAKLASEKGPEFAAALVKSIQDSPDVAPALEAKLAGFATASDSLDADLRNNIGPKIVQALGDIGKFAVDAFGKKFVLRDITEAELDQAHRAMRFAAENGGTLSLPDAVAQIATASNVAFRTNIALDAETNTAITDANKTLGLAGAPGGPSATAAGGLGAGMTNAYGQSVDFAGSTEQAASGIAAVLSGSSTNITGAQSEAESFGEGIGIVFLQGLNAGLQEPFESAVLDGTVKDLVARIERIAREAANAHSPSRLFAALGSDLMDGLTVGMKAATPGAVSQIQSSIGLVASAARIPAVSVNPQVQSAATTAPPVARGAAALSSGGISLALAEHAIDARGSSAVEVYDQFVTRSRNDLGRLAVQTG